MLTRWLPSTSILIAIGRVYRYQFKCNYLDKQKHFAAILLHFWNPHENLNILKNKNEPHSLSISEIIGSKKLGHLNAEKVLFPKTLGQST